MSRTAEERGFLVRAARAGRGGGLLRAAVLLARTQCPDADPDRVESALETLGAAVRSQGAGAATAEARARILASVLHGGRGLRGAREGPDDPRNSCLECVLDRGRGLPLSLSILWIEAARRAGWRAEGVGLPGHFVVRIQEEEGEAVLADPFHGGGVLTRADLKHLLHSLHGRPVRLRTRDVVPAPPREILLRLLRNLRTSYRTRGDRVRALAVAEDMLTLSPGLSEARRDRGMLLLEEGRLRAALDDLRAAAATSPRYRETTEILRLVETLTDDAEFPN